MYVNDGSRKHVKAHGAISGSATAAQLPSLVCRSIWMKAHSANVGSVYIGTSSSVTVITDSTTDTTTGIELDAGDELELWPASGNADEFYLIADNAGDDLTYLTFG